MVQQQEQQLAARNAKIANAQMKGGAAKLKPSYSIKRVLQTLFRNKAHKQQQMQLQHYQLQQQLYQQSQHQQQQPHLRLWNSLESLESFENLRNAQMEEQHFYEEIEDNSANEKLADLVAYEQGGDAAAAVAAVAAEEEEDIYVPVRFARTEAGTFFWTTNLQPVLSSFSTPIAADEDLLQPSYCYSNAQYPRMQWPPCNDNYNEYMYGQDRWAQA